MTLTIRASDTHFSAELQRVAAQYRHKIFVEKLGWPLHSEEGCERDQFDREDTVYIVAHDEHDQVCGCARLLPTTRPYLLREIFPQLLDGAIAPAAADVWEISRFAVSNNELRTAIPARPCELTRSLLAAVVERAARAGATRLITVSPLAVERLLQKLGVNSHRAGQPRLENGHSIFACWIEIDRQTKTALGLEAVTPSAIGQ